MLVLKRKVGEKIHIGNGVIITIVECTNKATKLGIEAPKDVTVYREELLNPQQIKASEEASKL